MLLMICSEACWNYYAWKRVFWSLVLAVCSANLAKLGSFRNICLKSALSVKKWLSFHSKLLHFAVWQYDECSTSHRLDVPPTLYSWQVCVSGFWCHRLKRPASLRRICVVTRGFQTTIQDLSVFPFLPRNCHMTRVLLSPFITTVWTPVVLAIINII